MYGPCKLCGAENYGLSTSGPDYCSACACGVPPEVSRLKREMAAKRDDHIDCMLALQLATGFKVEGMTPQMKQRGQAYLDKFTEKT